MSLFVCCKYKSLGADSFCCFYYHYFSILTWSDVLMRSALIFSTTPPKKAIESRANKEVPNIFKTGMSMGKKAEKVEEGNKCGVRQKNKETAVFNVGSGETSGRENCWDTLEHEQKWGESEQLRSVVDKRTWVHVHTEPAAHHHVHTVVAKISETHTLYKSWPVHETSQWHSFNFINEWTNKNSKDAIVCQKHMNLASLQTVFNCTFWLLGLKIFRCVLLWI